MGLYEIVAIPVRILGVLTIVEQGTLAIDSVFFCMWIRVRILISSSLGEWCVCLVYLNSYVKVVSCYLKLLKKIFTKFLKLIYVNNYNCLVSLVVLSATTTLEVLGSIPRSSSVRICAWVRQRCTNVHPPFAGMFRSHVIGGEPIAINLAQILTPSC